MVGTTMNGLHLAREKNCLSSARYGNTYKRVSLGLVTFKQLISCWSLNETMEVTLKTKCVTTLTVLTSVRDV